MTYPPILSGPIPPYNNPPIEPQFYSPSRFVITDIQQGLTTTITTLSNDNYVIGQLVRILIPNGYGINQLNEQTGMVIELPASNQVVVNIDSRNYDTFINANLKNNPQLIPVGDYNSGIISSTGRSIPTTNIPGSFINIS